MQLKSRLLPYKPEGLVIKLNGSFEEITNQRVSPK